MSDFVLDEDIFDIFPKLQESLIERGGKGSGHHGHRGRPGKVGGSLPSRDIIRPADLDNFIDLALTRQYDVLKLRDEDFWKSLRNEWIAGYGFERRDMDREAGREWLDNLPVRDRDEVLNDIHMMHLDRLEGQDFENAMDYVENNLPDGYKEALVVYSENLTETSQRMGSVGNPRYSVEATGSSNAWGVLDHRLKKPIYATVLTTEKQAQEWAEKANEKWIEQTKGKEEKLPHLIDRMVLRGGPGSGHHGHRGRPGKVGGSLPRGSVGSEKIVRKQFKSVLKSIPKKWRKGITLTYSREDYRSTHVPDSSEITIAEPDVLGLLMGHDLDNKRVGLRGHEVAADRVFETPDEMTAHLSRQVIAHEVAHVLRDRMSPDQRDRLGNLAERFDHHLESSVVNKYRGYFADIEGDYIRERLAERRLRSELSAEFLRIYMTDKGRFETYPKTLREGIADIFNTDPFVIRGGPGSGHHGHRGRPGEVGGSLPSGETTNTLSGGAWGAPITFRSISHDQANATQTLALHADDITTIAQKIEDWVHDDVKNLWVGDISDTLVWAVDRYNPSYGMHQGNQIIIGFDAFHEPKPYTIIHEFIHHIVQQYEYKARIRNYDPSDIFKHADRTGRNEIGIKSEDLVMMLTDYDSDREKWIDNLMTFTPNMVEGKPHDETGETSYMLDRTRASQKIDDVLDFLETLK